MKSNSNELPISVPLSFIAKVRIAKVEVILWYTRNMIDLKDYGITMWEEKKIASFRRKLSKKNEAGTKVLASQLSLDCRARHSG